MSRIARLDLRQLLADLKSKEFYGKVEIELARGEPKVLRVAETHLVGEERDEQRTSR
jgi:hypothetical protein